MARKSVAATAAALLISSGFSACSGQHSAAGNVTKSPDLATKHASPTACPDARVLDVSQPDPLDPLPRYSPAMAYDAVRKQVVMFGGKGGNGDLGDTWVWNGSNWLRQYPTHSPPRRALAAMTFDATHGVVVLFGGRSEPGSTALFLDDTWTWDGSDWTQQHPATSPPAAEQVPMDYNAAIGQVILLVTRPFPEGSVPAETWAWDGANWQRGVSEKRLRYVTSSAMAYDPVSKQMVFFAQGQTWTFNGTAWKQVAAHGPSQASLPNMTYDAATRSVVLFTGGGQGATWTWDGASWAQSCPVATPPPLTGLSPAMAYDAVARVMVVFGGSASSLYSNATWTWDGTTWSQWHAQPVAAIACPVVTGAPSSWHIYMSPHWRYCVAYPPTWYDLADASGSDADNGKNFSNQNVGAPLEMVSGGVWMDVTVNIRPDLPCGAWSGMSGPGVRAVPITIDGEATTKYISKTSMSVAVTHQSWCYEIRFLTYSGSTLDQNMNVMNAILASFRFNR